MMAAVDRISGLPEEIKVDILYLLPMDEAVRTSALSRSWRHVWTLRRGLMLILDDHDYGCANDKDCRSKFADHLVSAPEIVDHLLSSLQSPILYFFLDCAARPDQSPRIQNFLHLIYQKGGLSWLRLSCGESHPVPLQLPCFHLLAELKLKWIHLSLPSDFCGFLHLTTLELLYVRISQQDIQLLIDLSKNLRSFSCHGLAPADAEGGKPLSVTFNCPLLEDIQFCFQKSVTEARVVSAPRLKWAFVSASTAQVPPPEESAWVAAATLRFMEDIAHVSHLSLDTDFLKCSSRVDVPHALRVHFHQLRCLKLVGEMLPMDRRMYKMLFCLLRSMPLLQTLIIQCYNPLGKRLNDLDPITPNECMKKQAGFHCLDKTLRRVAISMVTLIDTNDIMMIRFILLNANVLEIVKIYCPNDPEVKSRILKGLSEVEKASLGAQVVFVHTGLHRAREPK